MPAAHRLLVMPLVALLATLASFACEGRGLVSPAGSRSAARAGSPAATPAEDAKLHFVQASGIERAMGRARLRAACDEQEVEVDDPYHGRRMRYLAMPLDCVLELGFADAGGAEALRGEALLLRALDGYTRPVSGADLLEPGAHLAIGEPDLAPGGDPAGRFTPIDRRGVDPAPYYLVWSGPERNDPHDHPWPYQLVRVEVAPFEATFPRTVPRGLAEDDPGWGGYALFQRHCASCHAINGEGGRIGPDLNVPRSIVEYRPIEQIRGYIRDPQATRYTSMPAHPGLSEADLDQLIAYFRAMRERKQDPQRDDVGQEAAGIPRKAAEARAKQEGS